MGYGDGGDNQASNGNQARAHHNVGGGSGGYQGNKGGRYGGGPPAGPGRHCSPRHPALCEKPWVS